MKKVKYYEIKGMTCAACVSAVEKTALKTAGIEEANVSLAVEQIRVVVGDDFDEKRFFRNIQLTGFKAIKIDETISLTTKQQTKLKKMFIRILLALIFLVPLLYISMGHMVGLPLPAIIDMKKTPFGYALIQLLLTLPVMVIGYRYYINGFKNIFRGHPNMDSLIAIGTISSFLYGLYGLIMINKGDISYAKILYFESSAVILVLVMVGKFMEQKSTAKTTEELEKLMDLKPKRALLLKAGNYLEIPLEDVKVDDLLLVREGDVVPTDGIIVKGNCSIDESMMTGEPLPKEKAENDAVIGGTLNVVGSILIKVTHVGDNTVLANIIKKVSEAQMKKAPIQKLADVISGVFVPTVFGLAIISFLVWFIVKQDFNFAINIFVSVLVIACPCALGLATPTAIMTSSGVAAKYGVLISSGDALEISSKITLVAFDKTGTITKGKPTVVDVISSSNLSSKELIQIAASLEQESSHPISKAILLEAEKQLLVLTAVENFENFTGFGVKGTINKKVFCLGNEKLMINNKISLNQTKVITDEYSNQGKTAVYLADETKLLGIISIADELEDNIVEVIKSLHKQNIKTAILSGDNEKTVEYIKEKVGIDLAYGSLLPEAKQAIIKELKKDYKVLMIGDGINDAIALKEANIGVGVSKGTDIAMVAGDVVLMKNDLSGLLTLIDLSKKTIKNIKQNLFWAFFYNIIGIPIAMGVLTLIDGPKLNPMIAAIAMSLSSVTVVLNALRLKKYKGVS